MTCFGCNNEAAHSPPRYGRLWCAGCLVAIEFEERQARGHGMAIVDVVKLPSGDVHIVFGKGGSDVSQEDLCAIVPRGDNVMDEITDSLVILKRSVVLGPDDVVIYAAEAAPSAAQKLIDTLDQFGPALGVDILLETAQWRRIAEQLASGPRPIHQTSSKQNTH